MNAVWVEMRAILAVSTLALCGCHNCTYMYAPSTVTVRFDKPDPWEPDTYQVELLGYTKDAMCVVTLPVTDGDASHCSINVDTLALTEAGDGIASIRVFEFAPTGSASRCAVTPGRSTRSRTSPRSTMSPSPTATAAASAASPASSCRCRAPAAPVDSVPPRPARAWRRRHDRSATGPTTSASACPATSASARTGPVRRGRSPRPRTSGRGSPLRGAGSPARRRRGPFRSS